MKKTILLLTFLTGFSGLVFQVVWQKYFSYFLGGEALSSAVVVSVFLAGLALGYYVFGKISVGKSAGSLLQIAGIAEIGIGIWVFLFPTLFELCWNNMDLLPVAQPGRGMVDLLLTIIMMAPATVLMGSTLPLLTSGLALQKNELSAVHSRVYGINTLGAFLGSLIAGFFLIKNLGLPISLMLLSVINIVAGVVIQIYGSRVCEFEQELPAAAIPETSAFSIPRVTTILAFLAGFISIGFEIIFMRSLSLAVGTSEYSYSLVVAIFVLMIGLGAISLEASQQLGVKRLLKNQIFQTIGLILVYFSIPYWGWINYVIRHSLATTSLNFYFYNFAVLLVFSIFISIPVFFMGRSMPLLFSTLDSSIARAAGNVGRLYAVNTFGSGLGGIVMGYLLLLFFNADIVFRLGVFLAAGSILIILQQLKKQEATPVQSQAIGWILLVASFLLPHWNPEYMAAGLYRMREFHHEAFQGPSQLFQVVNDKLNFLSYRDDPNTNVSVTEEFGVGRSLIVNGKSDGSTNMADLRTTLMLGHLPGLFANSNGRAAVVGLGLGTSAEVISRYQGIEHVDVFEIAKAIVDAQPLFNEVNRNVLANPKVSIFQRDAFRGLLAATDKYAVVISEPSNPWVSGVDRLYTTEFYDRVKTKMLSGGIFAQWMHTYEMSLETFGIVIRTFHQAFPHHRIFSVGSDLIILGSEAEFTQKQWETAALRWKSEDVKKDMSNMGFAEISDLAFREQFFPIEFIENFSENSLFFPKLSYAAAKDFFMGNDFQIADVAATHPLFELSLRRSWSNSLMRLASENDPGFSRRVLASCVSQTKNTAVFSYEKLDDGCKSKMLWLAASGALSLPKDKNELNQQVQLIKDLSLKANPDEALPLSMHWQTLKMYPWTLPTPSLDYLASLRTKCRNDSSPFDCQSQLFRFLLKFGYFEQARQVFKEDLLPQNEDNKALKELERMLKESEFMIRKN